MFTREQLEGYQRAGVRFIKEKKRCALFVDPGLGKTITTITSFCDMIDNLDCGRVLVVAPPQVSTKVWHREITNWAHTKNKSYVIVKGTPKQRAILLRRPASFHIISMDILMWLLKELGGSYPEYTKVIGGELVEDFDGNQCVRIRNVMSNGEVSDVVRTLKVGEVVKNLAGDLIRVTEGGLSKAKPQTAEDYEPGDDIKVYGSKWSSPLHIPYAAIVVDESSKVKSQDTNRWRVLKQLAPMVEYFVELTGTPSANGLEDLWAPMYLLDQGQRLGGTLTGFRERWFNQNYNGNGYRVKDWAIKVIEQRIADIVFTLREEDYGKLPPRMYNRIILTPDEATKEKYKKFERTYILKLSEEKKLIARDGAAITTKLLQLANGVVYNEEEGQRVEYDFHKLKLNALLDLRDELHGQPLLVVYEFKSDIRVIKAAVKGAVLFDGSEDMQDAWNRGEIEMMLVHRKSAAHGLNLQFGGCNAVWYGLTYSLEDYIQLNKRLHRKGQTKPVMIHHLIVEGTIDEDVMAALEGKNDMQEALLNALKKRVELYVRDS